MARLSMPRLTLSRLFGTLLLVLTTLGPTAPTLAPALAQDGDLFLPGLDSGGLNESDLIEDDTTIVVIWASWSPRCRDVVDRSNAIAAEWKDRAKVVMVNFQEDAPEIRTFLRGQTVRVPVYRDPNGRFSKKHSVTTLPSMLIYRQGRVVFQGRLPADSRQTIGEALQRR